MRWRRAAKERWRAAEGGAVESGGGAVGRAVAEGGRGAAEGGGGRWISVSVRWKAVAVRWKAVAGGGGEAGRGPGGGERRRLQLVGENVIMRGIFCAPLAPPSQCSQSGAETARRGAQMSSSVISDVRPAPSPHRTRLRRSYHIIRLSASYWVHPPSTGGVCWPCWVINTGGGTASTRGGGGGTTDF